jgi:hypothetical protein
MSVIESKTLSLGGWRSDPGRSALVSPPNTFAIFPEGARSA